MKPNKPTPAGLQAAYIQGRDAYFAQGARASDPRAPYDGRTKEAKAWYEGWNDAAGKTRAVEGDW